MDTITSEIVTTPIPVNTEYTFVPSSRLHIVEKGFTEYLVEAQTRYGIVNVFKNDGIIGVSMRMYGEYGQYEINLLNNFMNKESVVYDIGSNMGFHSLGLAEHSKIVYAFEANPKNYKLCKLNVATQPKVKVYNVAVSDSNRLGTVEDIDLDSQNNYGEIHVDTGSVECEFVKLDDFIKKQKLLPPTVIKIDVEGHEYEVLKGADETIRNNLPIIFYEHQHGDHLPEIYDYLTQLGYKIYWFPTANYNPQNYRNNSQNIFMPNSGVINALAIPFHMDVQTTLPVKADRTETYSEAYDKLVKKHEQSQQN